VAAGDCVGRLPPGQTSAGLLDVPGCGDGQSRRVRYPEVDPLKAEQREPQGDELERLRAEVAELRASLARLVLAGDADSRAIEGDLHDSVQQHLIALAVKVQLAGPLVDSNPESAKALLEEMKRDVQEALDEAARLAQRIYPQLLEAGGLAATLRSAAVSAGVHASVDVNAGPTYTPEILRTVYLCWLEVLEPAQGDARRTATVREEQGALTFEFASATAPVARSAGIDGLRARVEALGGRLTVESNVSGTYLSGSLPVSS
jgi:signal transduction histidine kinase